MSQNLEVQGGKIVASGLCLARTREGEIVFVEGLLPDENATIEVIRTKGKTQFGSIEKIISRSKDRIEPRCPHFVEGCGGCDFQHISVDAQRRIKREIVVDALNRIAKIKNSEELVSETIGLSVENYRTTARILYNSSHWGFRARNSHEMVSVESCMVMNKQCQNEASDLVEQEKSEKQQESDYQFYSFEGDYLEAQVRSKPKSIYGVEIELSDKSFYQSHIDAPNVLTKLIEGAIKDLPNNGVCVDFYSGVGVLALAVAKTGRKVICVEGNPHAIGNARVNLKGFDTQIVHSDVKKFFYDIDSFGGKCDLAMADPSREGIGKDGLQAILSCEAETLILISCDPASGARDISLLRENNYELRSCTPIDMFGYTHHVEMFSVLKLIL